MTWEFINGPGDGDSNLAREALSGPEPTDDELLELAKKLVLARLDGISADVRAKMIGTICVVEGTPAAVVGVGDARVSDDGGSLVALIILSNGESGDEHIGSVQSLAEVTLDTLRKEIDILPSWWYVIQAPKKKQYMKYHLKYMLAKATSDNGQGS